MLLQTATTPGTLLDVLQREIEATSLLGVLVGAGLGGLIGAGLRLGFEVILPQRYQDARRARRLLDKYRNPVVRAADALAGRIHLLLRTSEDEWMRQSQYFRLSTYYVVCAYFAWVDLLFGHLLRLRYSTSAKNRRLNRIVIAVDKAFNNLDYFARGRYPTGSPDAPSERQLSKFVCRALGELVVDRSERGTGGCIGFREFCRRYREDGEFRSWIAHLDPFLGDVRDAYGNTSWDRLHLVLLSLVSLTNFLDPSHEQSRHYSDDATRRLLASLNDPDARERFAADVARYRLPLRVEAWRTRWWRRLRIRFRASPVLRAFPDAGKRNGPPIQIRIDGRQLGLRRKDGRRKLYQEVERRAREITDRYLYGVRIRVRIFVGDVTLHPDVEARIPLNLAEVTGGRVRPEAVTLERGPAPEGTDRGGDARGAPNPAPASRRADPPGPP